MIRIHFTYRHTDSPWGGANNFIRALHQHLLDLGNFEIVPTLDMPCDILFMNQLATGPNGNGAVISVKQVERLLKSDISRGIYRKLVVRAVNLNWHAFPMGFRNLTRGWWMDRQTINLLNMADAAIFQSKYQQEFFENAGYRGKNGIVIHNGASKSFSHRPICDPPLDNKLRLISSTASSRTTKRHDLIAKFSLFDEVEVFHLGMWPAGLDIGRVKLLGTLSHDEMLRIFSTCHYFLHPAMKDPCPNSIFEAISAGIPVIYNPGPGSSGEIVGPCGIALDENNLNQTISNARQNLSTLQGIVKAHRNRCGIERAADQYAEIFRSLKT